ncbi:glycosyltransferase family 4 protein, partial [Candidatus Peregrinibacteria bacterium]|nr:glycosyltransferase family 4 protein [Candidatus Peregrinibacteria bacterium]
SLYGRSGMVHYASQLANALSKYHEVFILVPTYTPQSYFSKEVKLLRIEAPPSVIKTALLTVNPIHFWQIIHKIHTIHPQIIHFLDNHPWYLFLLPSLRRYKLMVTQHDVQAHPGEYMRGKMSILVHSILNRYADFIIVHGENLRNILIKKGFEPHKVKVIPFGDNSLFLKWKKKNMHRKPGTLLFFGRILYYKGLDIFLRAVIHLKTLADCPPLRVVIAGEGSLDPYQEWLQKLSKELKEELVIMNDYIPDNEIAPLFQQAEIVVLPYREASQSGVVHIAYTFKKPVIVTSVGSLPEVVEQEKTGIIIPPEDPVQLSKAMLLLLKDTKKQKKLGRAGYTKMKKELGWDTIAQRITDLYKEI